jgi:microcystin-dependent protein
MINKIFIALLCAFSFSIQAADAQEQLLGEVKMFAGDFAPKGWAFCHGQLLPIAQNTALFSLLGTIYGGDGRTTFALPDLRGRVAIAPGAGPGLSTYRQGQKGGLENTTLTQTNLPAHNHTVPSLAVDPASNASTLSKGNTSTVTVGNAPTGTVNTANAGGGQSLNNMQPFLSVNYIIAIEGLFPSRP